MFWKETGFALIMDICFIQRPSVFLLWMAIIITSLSRGYATTVYTSVGNRVILQCNSDILYPPWTGPASDGVIRPYNEFGSKNFSNPAVGDKNNRLSWYGEKDLVLNSVVRADNGTYECASINAQKQTVYLVVRVQPNKVEIASAENSSPGSLIIRGSEGIQQNLTCISSGGYPEQTVQWYRGFTDTKLLASTKHSVIIDTSSNTLNITQVAQIVPSANDDNIDYICQSAFKDEPMFLVQTQAKLYLHLKPKVPSLTMLGVLKEGDNKPIATCQTAGFRPKTSFNLTWIYQGLTTYYTGSLVADESNEKYSVSADFQKHVTRADNGRLLLCSVTHQTLSIPLTVQIQLNVQFKPLNATIDGNQIIVANGLNNLTLTCTSGSSNPVSTLSWKVNGNPVTADEVSSSNISGDNNGKQRRETLTLKPLRDNDGDYITCETENELNSGNPESATVQLELKYSPFIEPITPETVIEGNYSLLVCSASSKPPSTFRWYKLGVSRVLSEGNGTTKSNQLVYNITTVKRTDAAIYRCEADNGVENVDRKTVALTVLYPPDVEVEGTNTSVRANATQLICKANGVPNTGYTYGQWIQEWPGYGVVSRKAGSQTLTLVPLTYEHSGIYRCTASNGIKPFGKDEEYMEGSLNLDVKSFPVLSKPNTDDQDIVRVNGKLNGLTSASLEYYSNAGIGNVKCYRVLADSRRIPKECTIRNDKAPILLKVFSHTVPVTGIKVNISITINSEEEFGLYYVEVTNEIGSSNLTFEVVPEGPPDVAHDIEVNDIQQLSVTVSLSPGFHGGFDQTVVVQISTDQTTWTNKTVLFLGQRLARAKSTLYDLEDATTYFMRIFAYNVKGNSSLTETFNFTTLHKDALPTPFPSAVVGGVTGGIGAIVFVFVSIIVLKRRGYFDRGALKSKRSDDRKREDDAGSETRDNPMYVSADLDNKTAIGDAGAVYSHVREKALHDVYAQVNKSKRLEAKKELHNKKEEHEPAGKKDGTTSNEGDLYENAPVQYHKEHPHRDDKETVYEHSQTSQSKGEKKNVNKDGLIYVDLAFNKPRKGKEKFVVQVLDEKTTYGEIDFSRKAEPLPEGDNGKRKPE